MIISMTSCTIVLCHWYSILTVHSTVTLLPAIQALTVGTPNAVDRQKQMYMYTIIWALISVVHMQWRSHTWAQAQAIIIVELSQ